MTKIVINTCFGGFGISDAAIEKYHEFGGCNLPEYSSDVFRDDPILVRVVEALGSKVASAKFARLKVVEIPDGTEWFISDYDGQEHVAERHNTWC